MARDSFEDFDEGEGIKDAIPTILAVVTTIVLLVSVYMIQKALGDHFNEGMMKDAAQGQPE